MNLQHSNEDNSEANTAAGKRGRHRFPLSASFRNRTRYPFPTRTLPGSVLPAMGQTRKHRESLDRSLVVAH